MIKTLLFALALGSAISSFSFWPMKGPYYKIEKGEIINLELLKQEDLELFSKKFEENPDLFDAAFLYYKHTSLMMNIDFFKTMNIEKTFVFSVNEKKLNFLKGAFLYKDIPCFTKPNLNEDSMIRQARGRCGRSELEFQVCKGDVSFENYKLIFKSPLVPLLSNIFPKKSFESLSKIKIENRAQQVFLLQNEKEIELTTALKKHFTPPNQVQTDFIQVLPQLGGGSDKELLPKLYKYTYYQSIQDRLKESKILAVWCLISQEKAGYTIENQMIELAEDKEGKLFHWTTDLGKDNDVSVLMKYAE